MKISVQKIMMGLIIVIVLAFAFLRGDDLAELVETVSKGAVIPLIIAVLTQLCKYFAQSFAYSFAFSAVKEHMPARSTLPLVFGTFFMNTIAPSLNMAGITLVVDDARRRGIDPGKSTSAALLMQMSIESGFMVIMLVGFGILALTGNLDPLWFLLGLVVVVLVASLVAIMVLGRKKPQLVMKVLSPIERLVNRVVVKFKRKPFKPWAERVLGSFGEAASLIAHNPKTTAKVFGCSVVASMCELACFCLVGVAFGVTNPQVLVCGYVIATLFAMVSITPQGVGVVEAAISILFSSYDVNAAAGLAIALVYRSLVFWMPFLIGAILIQRTKTFKGEKAKKGEAAEDEAIEAALEGAHLRSGKQLESGGDDRFPPRGGNSPTNLPHVGNGPTDRRPEGRRERVPLGSSDGRNQETPGSKPKSE